MHPVRRAAGGSQTKAAVQQRVVSLKAEVDPAPLREALVVHLQVHVFAGGGKRPLREAEFRPPDVVVRQLEQVGLQQRHHRDGPRPRVLFQINQRALAAGLRHDGRDRRHPRLQRRLVSDDEKRAERVGLAGVADDFIFGVERVKQMCRVNREDFAAWRGRGNLVGRERTGTKVSDPVRHREGDVQIFREQHIRHLDERTMRVRVAGEPAALVHVDPAPELQLHADWRALHGDGLFRREEFLPVLGGENVAARWQFHRERMRRERCVHLDTIRRRSPSIFDGGTVPSRTLRKKPGSIR